jgi:hypothetical protein
MMGEMATFDERTTGIPTTKVNFVTKTGSPDGPRLRVSNRADRFRREDMYEIALSSLEVVAGTPQGHGRRVYPEVIRWLRQPGVIDVLMDYYHREEDMSICELLGRLEPCQLGTDR